MIKKKYISNRRNPTDDPGVGASSDGFQNNDHKYVQESRIKVGENDWKDNLKIELQSIENELMDMLELKYKILESKISLDRFNDRLDTAKDRII